MKQNKIPIFLISNNKYVPYLLVCITSILYNTNSYVEFYIIESDICNFRKNIIKNLEKKFNNCKINFIKSDLSKFHGLYLRQNFTYDTYNKLLIPDFVKDIKKAIYLDSDIIALDDISKLYSENIDKYGLGAIEEYAEEQWQIRLKKIFDINSKLKHFNSGVLLINCDFWRKNDITKKLLDLAKYYKDKTPLQDQGILNKFFHNNYKVLDDKYNLTVVWEKEKNLPNEFINRISIAKENVVIRHFIYDKPWNTNYYKFEDKKIDMFGFHEFWFFAKMTDFYDGLFNEYMKYEK